MKTEASNLAAAFWNSPSAQNLSDIRNFCATHPGNATVWVLYFKAALKLQHLDDAQLSLTHLQAKFPDRIISRTGPADIAFAKGKWTEATTLYAGLDPDLKARPEIVLQWVKASIRTGRMDSIQAVQPYLDSLPETVDVHMARALVATTLQDTDRARAAYQAAMDLKPHHPMAVQKLSALSEQQGDFDAARKLLQAALKKHPKNAKLRAELLSLRFRNDPFQISRDDIESHFQTSPDKAAALEMALRWARKCDDQPYLDTVLDRLDDLSPQKAVVERAFTDLGRGNPVQAIARLKDQTFPSFPNLRIRRARLLWNAYRSRHDIAGLYDLQEEVAKSTDLQVMAIGVGIARATGDMAAAETIARTLREASPLDPDAWCTEADVLTKNGSGQRALAVLDDAPQAMQSHPKILTRRYYAAWAIGDFETALTVLDQAATKGGNQSRFTCAYFLGRLGQLDTVAELIESWPCKTRIDQAWRLAALGEMKRWEFDFHAARDAFDQALELVPDLAVAYTGRAVARLLCFDPQGALNDRDKEISLKLVDGARPRKPRELIIGQLSNELLLDPQLTAQAQSAAVSDDPVGALLALFAQAPGNAMIAMGVLIAMRRTGCLDDLGKPLDPHVPKHITPKIFQYWEGGPPAADLEAVMNRLRDLNPWAEYHRFDAASARAYVIEHAPRSVVRAFSLARLPAERADLLRLVVLGREGGIWVDADDICRADLSTLIPADAKLVLYQEWMGSTGNNFIATEPGNRILQRMLDSIVQELLQGATESIWLRTGPGALSLSVVAEIAKQDPVGLPDGMHIVMGADLHMVIAPASPFGYKQTDSHWSKAEKNRGSTQALGKQKTAARLVPADMATGKTSG